MKKKYAKLHSLIKESALEMSISSKKQIITWGGSPQTIKPLVELLWEESVKSHSKNEDIELIGNINTIKKFEGMYDDMHLSTNSYKYKIEKFLFHQPHHSHNTNCVNKIFGGI
jgi:hypothetical protein